MANSLFGKIVGVLTGTGAATDDDSCSCGVEIEEVEGES